jgi:hypothetical protein
MYRLRTKPLVTISVLLIAAMLAGGCGASPTTPPIPTTSGSATEAPTAIQPTATALSLPTETSAPAPTETSLPAPTSAPTVAPTATALPAASPTPTPTPVRITFARGTTSALVEGNLAANAVQYYVLGASANQLLDVSVTPGDNVRLSIYGVDGEVLMSGMGGGAFFRGHLPTTQDYILALAAGPAATAYSMNVIIPARISFAPGSTSAVVEGNLATHGIQYYSLGASAGQLMEVNTTPDENVRLSIYGVDGEVLRSGMAEGAFFRGYLPSTQDYILALAAGPVATAYSMNVIIPARISFKPGAISGQVQGQLAAFGAQYYILGASASQVMEVNVTPTDAVRLSIYGVDGEVLMSGMGGGGTFEGTLPSTQDYIVVVGTGDQAVSYTLQATIQ